MKIPAAHRWARQSGAVLIVSLILLVVMTLFVLSMLKTSIIELKIGGASQVAAVNFSNAELAINNFVAANNGRFGPGFLTTAGANRAINNPLDVTGGSVQVIPNETQCVGAPSIGGTQMGVVATVQFNVRAVASGALGGSTTVVQGVESWVQGSGCQ